MRTCAAPGPTPRPSWGWSRVVIPRSRCGALGVQPTRFEARTQRWPKLFRNLRSCRETELAEEFPMDVVCQWIGNSQPIAAKHYLQVIHRHFSKAVRNSVQ